MKTYQISNLKDFMNKLLLTDVFDCFLLEEGTIVTSNTFQIDGHVQKNFYTKEEQEDKTLCPYDFSLWKDIRPLCFQLIKGKRTPLGFQFVLLLLPAHMKQILEKGGFQDNGSLVKYFTLTIRYDNIHNGTNVVMITGLSTNTFLMDKTPGQLWDDAFGRFMSSRQISWEEA